MFRQILIARATGGAIAFVLSAMQNAVMPAGAPRRVVRSSISPVTRRSVCLERHRGHHRGHDSRDDSGGDRSVSSSGARHAKPFESFRD